MDKSEKTKESSSSGVDNKEKDGKGKATAPKGDDKDKSLEKNGIGTGEKVKNSEKKEQGDAAGPQTADVKTGKKKIIRRIVKQKVANKKTNAEIAVSMQNESLEEKDAGETNERSEIPVEQNESSADPSGVKTFVRKKVIKKVPAGKAAQNEDKGLQPGVKNEKEVDNTEDSTKDNSQTGSGAPVQGTSVKTAIKKKIIKRVLKRKLAGVGTSDGATEAKKDEKIVAQTSNETDNMEKERTGAESQRNEMQISEKKIIPKSKAPTVVKEESVPNSTKSEIKAVKADKKDDKEIDGKIASGAKIEGKDDKQKVAQRDNSDSKRGKSKDDEKSKHEKDKDGKDESRSKSNKETKEKRMAEEPPRHPGLIFQTKGDKETKVC